MRLEDNKISENILRSSDMQVAVVGDKILDYEQLDAIYLDRAF